LIPFWGLSSGFGLDIFSSELSSMKTPNDNPRQQSQMKPPDDNSRLKSR
jgi:hypothetical protein